MQVFVTGGSGSIGPSVVSELINAGHEVTALSRTDESAKRLTALGATPVQGTLEDHEILRSAARQADGVIHLAFGRDMSDLEGLVRLDLGAIQAMGEALAGSGKPLVTTSATLIMPAHQMSTEQDAPDPASLYAFRLPSEQACLALAEQGVRSSVVRLPPTVHGPGDNGAVAMLIAATRSAGTSAYIGDGQNRWPAVHRSDAATLFRLAVEKAPAGQALHAVAEEAVPFKVIAETVGGALGLPVQSVAPETAEQHFGNPFMPAVFGADVPISSTRTRQLLDWQPAGPTLLSDLEDGHYFEG